MIKNILTLLSTIIFLLLINSLLLGSSQPYITGDHQINFGSGNKYLVETDVSLFSSGPLFAFTRIYNSQGTENSSLGYGWTNSFQERLNIDGGDITRVTESGRHIVYQADGVDQWSNQLGKYAPIISITGGYQLTLSNDTVYTYDANGRLIETKDKNDCTRTFLYAGDLLDSVTDSYGRSFSFVYNIDNRLETLSTPIGTFTYTYLNDNLISLTKPDSTIRQYIYDDSNDTNNLTGVIDEESVRILTVTYDTSDRVISSSLAGVAEEIVIDYPSGLQRTLTDSLGNTTTYQLETLSGVVRVSSSSGSGCITCLGARNSSYTHTARQLLASVTNGRGFTTTYDYDTRDNRIEMVEASGAAEERTTLYTYETDSSRISTIERQSAANPSESKIVTRTYDINGNLESGTEEGFDDITPISRTISYIHDSLGRITFIDGPRLGGDVSDTISNTYYPDTPDQGFDRGQFHTRTNGLGHITTYSNYNAFGKPELISDPNSSVSLGYDSMGRMITMGEGGGTTTYHYDDTGKLEQIDLPDARTVSYGYTPAGRLETVTDLLGNMISYSYDSAGNRVTEELFDSTPTLKKTLTFEYDSAGRLNKTINPDSSFESMAYDDNNNLVSFTDELSNNIIYSYDPLDRLDEITKPGPAVTTYSYNVNDNIVSVTDAELNDTTQTYDDFGNLTKRLSPDTGEVDYFYDEAGNLTGKEPDTNNRINYTYDALNRLTGEYPLSGPVTTPIEYTYDEGTNGVGHLTSVSDQTGTSVYTYDQFGIVLSDVRTVSSGKSFTTGYAFNSNHELTSITYPSGRIVSYDRNGAGRVQQIRSDYNETLTVIADNIDYLPFGPVTAMSYGNGLNLSSGYDLQYRLTSSMAGTIFNRSYDYFTDGRVSTITDVHDISRSQSFGYDALGRLTGASGIYGSLLYTYDLVDNRLSGNDGGILKTYTYLTGSNKLSRVSGTQTVDYLYDDRGNTEQQGAYAFIWDADSKLINIEESGNTIATFGYDYGRLRTEKSVPGERAIFSYDRHGNLIAEMGIFGIPMNDYVYLDGKLIAKFAYPGEVDLEHLIHSLQVLIGSSTLPDPEILDLSGNGLVGMEDALIALQVEPGLSGSYWYINDHLGIAQQITDATGSVVWQGDYRPFGGVDSTTELIDNPFRFPGQYFDSEAGLHYSPHRYYDPETGRYISADTNGHTAGLNVYSYARQNPLNSTEPHGLYSGTDLNVTLRLGKPGISLFTAFGGIDSGN